MPLPQPPCCSSNTLSSYLPCGLSLTLRRLQCSSLHLPRAHSYLRFSPSPPPVTLYHLTLLNLPHSISYYMELYHFCDIRSLTWETGEASTCLSHITSNHTAPQPLDCGRPNLLSTPCTQHLSSHWNNLGICTASKAPLFSLVQRNSHWSFIY